MEINKKKILTKKELLDLEGDEEDPEIPSKKELIPLDEVKDYFIFENAKAGIRLQAGSSKLDAKELANLVYQFLVLVSNPEVDPNEPGVDYIK